MINGCIEEIEKILGKLPEQLPFLEMVVESMVETPTGAEEVHTYIFGLLKYSFTLFPINLIYHSCLPLGNLYGNCCGKNCGGYEGGRPALEYAAEGEFDDAPVTEWVRGQPAEVYWQQTAEHRGGYAYRLCKVHHVTLCMVYNFTYST